MTPPRAITFMRGVGSFLTLVAVLVVPPAALSTLIGWPLPTAIPDLSSLGLTLRSGVSDELIVNILAVIAWLAWAQIAIAIVTELVAVVRGRPSIHLPVLPGIQATAARLVAGIVMTTATITPTAAMASPTPPVIAAPAATADPLDLPVLDLTATPPVAGAADISVQEAPAVAPTITVDRHDSYWAIAERTLGNGYRWSEIRDLNVGRTMTTGHIVQAGSDLVHPGWILELPADAEPGAVTTTEAVSTEAPPTTVDTIDPAPVVGHAELTVEEGDNFWALAEEQLAASTGQAPTAAETAPYWQDLIDANTDRLVEPHNPDLILPGQRLCVPPIAGTATGGTGTEVDEPPTPVADPAAPEIDETTPTATPTPVSAEDAESSDPADHQLAPAPAAPTADTPPSVDQDQTSDSPTSPIAAGAASVALAAGVTLAIRRRRRRAAHRNPTRQPRPTTEENRQLQSTLVAEGDIAAIEDLRRCLAQLAQSIAHSGGDARPRVVQHADDYIGVYLDAPSPNAPPGWSVGGEGAVWSLEADSTEANPGEEDTCAAPLLVTLGQPDEGGQLYLDLEAAGVVALSGDDVAAHGVARAMLTELALTPLADALQVLVVGPTLVPAEAESLDHVSVADSWDDASDNLAAWAEQSHNVLTVKGWPNVFVARGHDPDHDALAPVVVVASQPPPPELLAILRANHPATLAVVAVGEIAGATTIKCTNDSLSIPEIGLLCTPHPLDPETLDAIIDLLDDAEAEGTEPLDDSTSPPPPVVAEPQPEPEELSAAEQDPDADAAPPDLTLFSTVTESEPATANAGTTADADDAETPEAGSRDDEGEGMEEPVPSETPTPTDAEQTGPGDVISHDDLVDEPESVGIGGGADSTESEGDLVPPVDEVTDPMSDDGDGPDGVVLVRVLGQITVEGLDRPLTGKETAAVAYIALHGTVTSERLEDSVWPSNSSGSSRKALNNTMSKCRGIVGARLLPTAAGGVYNAGPGLVTDIELFEQRTHEADEQCAAEAADTLRSALDLVTGPLFSHRADGRSSYTWVDLENWVSLWELKLAAAAQRCARLLLDLERPDEAVTVAFHALGIIPTHTGITETLMRAHAANGDRLAVTRVYQDHLSALQELDIDDADESTSDLYNELLQPAAL